FAGHGRPMPGARFAPWFRAAVALPLGVYATVGLLSLRGRQFPFPQPALISGPIVLGLQYLSCEYLSRKSAPGLVAPGHALNLVTGFMNWGSMFVMFGAHAGLSSLGAHSQWGMVTDLVAFAAVVFFVWRLNLCRLRLASLGITPWAP